MTQPLLRRGRARLAVLAVAAAALAGCSGAAGAVDETPTATSAPHAGAYPVATPVPQVTSTPTVSAGGYQLVAAGDPVRVVLPDADLVAVVAGPEVDVPVPAPGQPITAQSAPGVLSVTLTVERGQVTVPASSFLALDEDQDPVALTADAPTVTATPGHPATLQLSSRFATGHTTLTWQPLGSPLITWDFVVEID